MTKPIQLPSGFHNQVFGETLNCAFQMDNKVFQQLGLVMIHQADHGTQLKKLILIMRQLLLFMN